MSDCIGQKFRCNINTYVHNDTYSHSIQMRRLKRKSCLGCEECGWVMDELAEHISCDGLPIIQHPNHGAIYSLRIVNISRDWETGYIDDYDLEFIEETP